MAARHVAVFFFFYAERSTAMRLPTNDKTVDFLGNFEYMVVGVLPDWASCPVLPHTMAIGHTAYAYACIQFRGSI